MEKILNLLNRFTKIGVWVYLIVLGTERKHDGVYQQKIYKSDWIDGKKWGVDEGWVEERNFKFRI